MVRSPAVIVFSKGVIVVAVAVGLAAWPQAAGRMSPSAPAWAAARRARSSAARPWCASTSTARTRTASTGSSPPAPARRSCRTPTRRACRSRSTSPPGRHALVLSTFADSDGTQLLGIGCTEADLSAGSQICFDLTIEPAPDGGDDLSARDCATRRPTIARPARTATAVALRARLQGRRGLPEERRRRRRAATRPRTLCAECVTDANCGGAPGVKCCNQRCVNTKSDAQNCNGVRPGLHRRQHAVLQRRVLEPDQRRRQLRRLRHRLLDANASAATCGGSTCAWTCNGGFAHCAAGNTGCETNLGSAGKKLCGTTCVAASSCCNAADCMSPPAPAACRQAGICSGIGGTARTRSSRARWCAARPAATPSTGPATAPAGSPATAASPTATATRPTAARPTSPAPARSCAARRAFRWRPAATPATA